jgi:tetratricopeptide (TPR) repeat protein
MKRLLFLLLLFSLIFFMPMPTQVLGDDEDGPNLDIPADLDEKAKKYLEEGIKTYKEMKKRSENRHNEPYKRPPLRMKDSDKRKKKVEKLIKLFQKAAKAAPKCHLPPFYLCIMYQWKSDFEGGAKSWVQKGKVQGAKAMKLLDNFYEAALELADICMRLEKYDEALKAYFSPCEARQ